MLGGWPPDPMPEPDGDGSVEMEDVFFASDRFGASVGDLNYTSRAEIVSQDGVIGIDDVFGYTSRLGRSC